jgi:hypothetical protein
MPPRYAYWTILVDNQPTAFRAGAQEDLMPTFKRLKEKHPSAVMMWFQNGKLWNSRLDAQEAMRARGEMGRRGDERQSGFRDRDRRPPAAPSRRPERPRTDGGDRREWAPKPTSRRAPRAPQPEKLDWKPKGAFTPASKRSERPEWNHKPARSQPRGPERPEWKAKPAQSHRPSTTAKPEWKPRDKHARVDSNSTANPAGRAPLDWKPKAKHTVDHGSENGPAKRKWIPKEEYKKSKGIEVARDSKWRPGGAHRDPRQKYKDAKKAKWTGFKKAIRTKWESKQRKRDDDK